MRLLVVGASTEPVCGARDCAAALAPALERVGCDVETHWWDIDADGRPSFAEARRFAREAATCDVDVILWHYSVFTYAHRGVALLAPFIARDLARSKAPVFGFMHELVYPWGRRGWRGTAQAASQRAALSGVVHSLAGVLVTTEQRSEWLRTRRWLPSRPVAFVPVVSNLPIADANGPETAWGGLAVGMLGFRTEGLEAEVVTDAVARVNGARLVLVGAPGPDAPEADRWRRASEESGCALEFTGVLPPAELAERLAKIDVVVFPDHVGPSARRGTLAAALAAGKPVVAIDGPQRWDLYRREDALRLIHADADELGIQLAELVDASKRDELGARGRAFYDCFMAPDVVAGEILSFISGATP